MRANQILLCICLSSVIAFGQEPPRTMTKLVVHLQSPDAPEGSFAAQPKIMYRAGTGFCRIEESADSEHGIHGLLLVNEPDEWLVNLITKSGRHFVDPGPTFNCRLPIFVFGEDIKSAADLKKPLMDLEFGRELAFFVNNGAIPSDGPNLQGKSTKVYTVNVADSQLLLFTNGAPELPVAIARQHGDVREVYWYGDYAEIPFDGKLFAPPNGVKIEEAKPSP